MPEFSDPERSAIKASAKTMMALDLLKVIVTHDTNGAVIDTDHPIDELGAIVDKDAVYAKIASLLDDATTDLDAGSAAFPFEAGSGFTGFETPKTFRKFNRAIRARVAAYTKDYATALTALGDSFLDDTAMGNMNDGVFYSFSTKSGDLTNGLTNKNIYAHPSLMTDAEMNGATVDLRYTAKVTTATSAGAAQSLSSNLKFTLYPDRVHVRPLIRNEELILLVRGEVLHRRRAGRGHHQQRRARELGRPAADRGHPRRGNIHRRAAVRAALLAAVRRRPPLGRSAPVRRAAAARHAESRPERAVSVPAGGVQRPAERAEVHARQHLKVGLRHRPSVDTIDVRCRESRGRG